MGEHLSPSDEEAVEILQEFMPNPHEDIDAEFRRERAKDAVAALRRAGLLANEDANELGRTLVDGYQAVVEQRDSALSLLRDLEEAAQKIVRKSTDNAGDHYRGYDSAGRKVPCNCVLCTTLAAVAQTRKEQGS